MAKEKKILSAFAEALMDGVPIYAYKTRTAKYPVDVVVGWRQLRWVTQKYGVLYFALSPRVMPMYAA